MIQRKGKRRYQTIPYTSHVLTQLQAMAEEFIHIFVNQPEWLTKFLEFIITQGVATPPIYNTLLELYLRENVRAS